MLVKLNFNFRNLLFFSRLKHVWVQPEGFDTGIKVYNCVVKEKVPLIVKNKKFVTWYTCGPTVYDSSHLGHASCYVRLDIIQKILRNVFNLNLITVMNITDIDDKIIKASIEKNLSMAELAKNYENEFWKDLELLNITKPDLILHVTNHIDLIRNFIKKLIDNKQAYVAPDNSVYFDVSSSENYGKLQNIGCDYKNDIEKEGLKRSPQDFALWKASKKGEPFWASEWGNGRPGWHIECSALAGSVFGSTIDIHAGGIDLRFPHHENEEAQSCAYFSRSQWVNYWLHTGHLHTSGSVKMSKSLKNTIRISELLEKYDANTFRMACLISHYSSNMEFSDDLMQTAENNLKNLKNFYNSSEACFRGHLHIDMQVDESLLLLENISDNIDAALRDDFDVPLVLKNLNSLMTGINRKFYNASTNNNNNNYISTVPLILINNFVKNTFSLFGISNDITSGNNTQDNFVEVMQVLNDFRQNLRSLGIETKNKHILKYCDEVRNNVKKYGVVITDYGKQSTWFRQ